ncbi:MAG: hypothetical protein AAFX06_32875, partial [Planctomycetota bacterium]
PGLFERLWAQYRNETVAALLNDPEEVARNVRGISNKRAEAAAEKLRALIPPASDIAPPSPGLTGTIGLETIFAPTDGAEVDEQWPVIESTEASGVDRAGGKLLNSTEVRARMLSRWESVFSQRRHAESVLRRHEDSLLKLPNVTGVHVGFRRRNARGNEESMVTEDLECCIRIHVDKKHDMGSAAFADERIASPLPKVLDGIHVDVLERSYVTFDDSDMVPLGLETPFSVDTRADPVIGGVKIANEAAPANAGTLGGVVFFSDSARYITNRHVVGASGNVLQPPGSSDPNGIIGTVEDSEIPTLADGGSIDCAIIRPSGPREPDLVIRLVSPNKRFVPNVLTQTDVHRTRAFKVGAFTDRTSGIVQSVNAVVNVNRGVPMPNQIIVEADGPDPIIKGGDSGSLLLVQSQDPGTIFVVGLVHARSTDNRAIIATHFHEIQNRFGVTL